MCRAVPGGVRRVCRLLRRIRALAANLSVAAADESPDVRQWTAALVRQSAAMRRDIGAIGVLDSRAKAADLGTTATFALPPAPESRSASKTAPRTASQSPSFAAAACDERRSAATGDGSIVDGSCGAGGAIGVRGIASLDRRLDHGCTLRQLASTAARVADRITQLFEVTAENGRTGTRAANPLDAGRSPPQPSGRPLRRGTIAANLGPDADSAGNFAAMDFRFLYHAERKLLSIGYNVSQQRHDDSYYGLLASEARLTSFLAVSHGQLPLEHWFALGRTITLVDAKPMLLSWSGSMFEYLMPMLLMPSFRNTILDSSCRRAVRRQIRYARQKMGSLGDSRVAAPHG